MQKLLIQAKEENYYELFLLEFATGLRLGELMALQWDDLDLVTGELKINKQAVITGSELVITEPKTKAAVRTLLLPPKVLEVFREYRKRNASRWLFPSPKRRIRLCYPRWCASGCTGCWTTLNTYSHITDEMRQQAAVKIDAGIAKTEPMPIEESTPQERTMTDFQARKRWSRTA